MYSAMGLILIKNELQEPARDIVRRQRENARQVCENLRKIGISFPNVHELDGRLAKPSAQQPHELVILLQKLGYGTGEPSAGTLITDAGFLWATTDIATVVDAAHRSGAVCLIAHPGRGEGYTCYDAQLFDELRRHVPIDGLEIYYPAHTLEQMAMYRDYAKTHHLLTSSGSDSHGPEKKPIKYRAELSQRLLERLGIQISYEREQGGSRERVTREMYPLQREKETFPTRRMYGQSHRFANSESRPLPNPYPEYPLIGRGGFDGAGASWMVSDCPATVSLYIASPGRFIRHPHLVAQFVD
jgi:hypothetical protein